MAIDDQVILNQYYEMIKILINQIWININDYLWCCGYALFVSFKIRLCVSYREGAAEYKIGCVDMSMSVTQFISLHP